MSYPKNGRFGEFGGKYIPETLVPAIEELEENYLKFRNDKKFKKELNYYLREFAGRPTPLYFAKNLTEKIGGAKIYLKREDLCHGGAHKINNTLGQALLAKKMKKKRIIAETGAGQHGVATAMACAALGMKAEVYMGFKDTERQKLNVFRMNLLGTNVHPVKSGSQTLKDAINEAIRDWITNVETTYYLLGSSVGQCLFGCGRVGGASGRQQLPVGNRDNCRCRPDYGHSSGTEWTNRPAVNGKCPGAGQAAKVCRCPAGASRVPEPFSGLIHQVGLRRS